MNVRRRALAVCLSLIGLGLLVPSAPALGASQLQFDVLLGGCVAGRVPTNATGVDVVWRDSAGLLKARFTVPTTNDWTWFAPRSVCRQQHAASGDRLRAHVSQPTSLTRTFTVPRISGSFGRAGVSSGVAPTRGDLLVATWAQYLSRPKFFTRGIVHLARNSAGEWSYDWSHAIGGWTPRGGDRADAVWTSPSSDSVTLRMRIPFLEAWVGRARVTGFTAPYRSVALVLRAGDGTVRGSAKTPTGGGGAFSLTFRHNGVAVPVNDGDQITGNWARNAAYTVVAINAPYSVPGNWVNAICARQSEVGMWGVWSNSAHPFFDGTTHADGTTGPIDVGVVNHQLAVGDRIDLVCGNANGDRTHFTETVSSSPD